MIIILNKEMALKVIWLFAIISVFPRFSYCVNSRRDSVRRMLEALNKPYVKTFKNEAGDDIDCVPIHKQPALDHPLLKDHRISMGTVRTDERPSSDAKKGFSSVIFAGEECPYGTVPIQRTREEDLKTQDHSHHLHAKVRLTDISSEPTLNNDHVFAMLRTKTVLNRKYFGASACISVWGIGTAMHDNQSSSASILLQSGYDDSAIHLLGAGWIVSKRVNGDRLTRLFTHWFVKGDRGVRGCFNTVCQGFVQVDRRVTPNAVIHPLSVYGGPTREINITVIRDFATFDWWFVAAGIKIGYWPKEILDGIEQVDLLGFGGVAASDRDSLYPPMGSGHKPDGSPHNSAYFRVVTWRDTIGEALPFSPGSFEEVVIHPNCYRLHNDEEKGPWAPDYSFFFGGEGGRCMDYNV